MHEYQNLTSCSTFRVTFTFKNHGRCHTNSRRRSHCGDSRAAPGDYSPEIRRRAKVTIIRIGFLWVVTSNSHVETLYRSLSDIDDVRYVL